MSGYYDTYKSWAIRCVGKRVLTNTSPQECCHNENTCSSYYGNQNGFNNPILQTIDPIRSNLMVDILPYSLSPVEVLHPILRKCNIEAVK